MQTERHNDGTAAAGTEPSVAPPRRKKKPFLILGGGAVVVLVVIGIYAIVTHNIESTDDAQVSADLVPISARVGGQIAHVAITENQPVKKGDLLAEIDPAELTAKLQQAEAELATAAAQSAQADAQAQVVEASSKGNLQSAQAGLSGSSVAVQSADAQIAAAKAAVARAEADLRRADNDLRRAKELRTANAAPQAQLDNAQATQESAAAALSLSRAQLVAADESRRGATTRVAEAQGRLAQSSPVEAQIAAARAAADLGHARVRAASASLELARLQLSYARITAPGDGSASKLSVHEGQLVSPGQIVLELVPAETYVVANFKETQIAKMRPGQSAKITIDAYSQTFEGTVESLSGGTGASFSLLPPDNASGNFVKVVQRVPVRVAWKNPPRDLHLAAGLSAVVKVHVQ